MKTKEQYLEPFTTTVNRPDEVDGYDKLHQVDIVYITTREANNILDEYAEQQTKAFAQWYKPGIPPYKIDALIKAFKESLKK